MNQHNSELLQSLEGCRIPAHVGIIMDGNGRWAKARGKQRVFGHTEGAKRVKAIIEFAGEAGIKHISLYAFSIENWARPSLEVSAIMALLKSYIVREREELHKANVKFRLVGRKEGLAPEIIKEIETSEKLMENNTGLSLNLCVNYGGRAEIADAVKAIIKEKVKPEDVTEDLIAKHLYCPQLPDADLIIRTSGEMRTSNFLLWRAAYSEFYVTDTMWPDFDCDEFTKALLSYGSRERRFGKTGEQVK